MYVDTTTTERNGKVYVRHLLRTSFREKGKVKHKTLLNLSPCSEEEIAAIKLALKHKGKLTSLASLGDIETTLGKSIGAVWALNVVAQRTGLSKALGAGLEARTAMLQVVARVIDQGSRLSAVRLARRHAACEILGIKKLDENDLYKNLAWLADNQEKIEQKLFRLRHPKAVPSLFLYDVTSSYLEGDCNELAAWGYNRDGKKGKRQIVVGLLADQQGEPVAVRVFEGNTQDAQTVGEQVRTLAEGFGVREVTLVGDRGMLKGPQIDALPDDFRYVTAITKPQIRKLLGEGVLQLDLFHNDVCEVEHDGVRYIMRRNPLRAEQSAQTRASKLEAILAFAERQTSYLAEHPRAQANKALERVRAKIKKLKADKWLAATENERAIVVEPDADALAQAALLDGCYVIKSDVSKKAANAQTLHDRYCDLEMVERAFRTMKTAHLDMRPVFVRKEKRTQGHAFVVMLALLLQRELERSWAELDVTVQEGLDELAAVHLQEVGWKNTKIQNIPNPTGLGKLLLKKADIPLPSALPKFEAKVHTTKKLPSERIHK